MLQFAYVRNFDVWLQCNKNILFFFLTMTGNTNWIFYNKKDCKILWDKHNSVPLSRKTSVIRAEKWYITLASAHTYLLIRQNARLASKVSLFTTYYTFVLQFHFHFSSNVIFDHFFTYFLKDTFRYSYAPLEFCLTLSIACYCNWHIGLSLLLTTMHSFIFSVSLSYQHGAISVGHDIKVTAADDTSW